MTRASKKATQSKQKWSASVTRHSDALDLEKGVFKKPPHAMALSLKRSAMQSHRRRAEPYRSALSMLNFYMNRAGKNLKPAERKKLNTAKTELKKLFHHQ